jgi:serine/threonine protein kinase
MERYKEKFIKEAKTIARLDHPNIIHIHDVFKENNTCYYVMDYIDGESLHSRVKRLGALPEATAVAFIREVAAALSHIHSLGINHLDIKPGNIMVREADRRAILIDFGLAKQYDAQGNQTSSTPVGISHGFAPMEQYKVGGVSEFTPATDIYSLGATLYYLVTGSVPPQASDIAEDGLPALPAHLSVNVKRAITSAMQTRRKDRVQSVEAFLELLGGGVAAAAPSPAPALDGGVKIGGAVEDESTRIGETPKPIEQPKPAPKPVEQPKPAPKPVEQPKPAPKPVEQPKRESTLRIGAEKPTKKSRKSRWWAWILGLLLIGGGTYFVIDANRSDDSSLFGSDKITEDTAAEVFDELYSATYDESPDRFISLFHKMNEMYESASESDKKLLDDGVDRWRAENPDKAERIQECTKALFDQGLL